LDSSRLRTGEIVAGIAGIALFVFLFFDWFAAGEEGFDTGGVSGWDGLGTDVSGFIVFLAAVAGPALALLAMSGQRFNVPAPRGAGTAALGLLTVAIIVWRIFANPGDLKVGLFLGLAAAIALAAGALLALREDGIEALVSVPGGRTRAASASAPPATPTPPPVAKQARRSGGSSSSTTRRSTAKKPAAKKPAAKKPAAARSGSRTGAKSGRSKAGGSRSTSSRSRSSSTKSRSSKSSRSRSSSSSKSSGSRSSSAKRSSRGGKKK
jgi:hypothetical protein